MLVLTLCIVYFICVPVIYSIFFGYTQNKFHTIAENHYYADMGNSMIFSLVYGLFGPFGVLLALMLTKFGRFGFKFK